MTKREFLDTVFALAPNEANAIMDAFDEYVESNEPSQVARDIARIVENEKDMRAIAQPEIIHCRDCRYNDGTAYCEMHYRDVKGSDFCSWGERRQHESERRG